MHQTTKKRAKKRQVRSYSAKEISDHLKAHRDSGEQIPVYAAKAGVPYSTFYSWFKVKSVKRQGVKKDAARIGNAGAFAAGKPVKIAGLRAALADKNRSARDRLGYLTIENLALRQFIAKHIDTGLTF